MTLRNDTSVLVQLAPHSPDLTGSEMIQAAEKRARMRHHATRSTKDSRIVRVIHIVMDGVETRQLWAPGV